MFAVQTATGLLPQNEIQTIGLIEINKGLSRAFAGEGLSSYSLPPCPHERLGSVVGAFRSRSLFSRFGHGTIANGDLRGLYKLAQRNQRTQMVDCHPFDILVYLGFVRLYRLPPVRAVLGATEACLCKNRLSGGSVSDDCQRGSLSGTWLTYRASFRLDDVWFVCRILPTSRSGA